MYTPGPTNIACTSIGIKYGVKQSINFIYGSVIGFSLVTLLSGLFSKILFTVLPSLELILRLVGSVYILYLTYNILNADYSFSIYNGEIRTQPLGFKHGILMQLVNPKMIIFVLTLYTVFLCPITNNIPLILFFTLILGVIEFGANFFWAFLGSSVRHFLNQQHLIKAVNFILSMLLIFTAFRLTETFLSLK